MFELQEAQNNKHWEKMMFSKDYHLMSSMTGGNNMNWLKGLSSYKTLTILWKHVNIFTIMID